MPSPRNSSAFPSTTTICSGVCFKNSLMIIHPAQPHTARTTQSNPHNNPSQETRPFQSQSPNNEVIHSVNIPSQSCHPSLARSPPDVRRVQHHQHRVQAHPLNRQLGDHINVPRVRAARIQGGHGSGCPSQRRRRQRHAGRGNTLVLLEQCPKRAPQFTPPSL